MPCIRFFNMGKAKADKDAEKKMIKRLEKSLKNVKKVTPVTVAVSEFEPPRVMEALAGLVVTPGVAGVTVKHSRVVEPSDPPA